VELVPAPRTSHDVRAQLDGHTLSRLLSGLVLEVSAQGRGLSLRRLERRRSTKLTVVEGLVSAASFRLPALRALDARDRPMRHLDVEPTVHRDDPLRVGVNAVDGEVEVVVVRVPVERVDALVSVEPELVQEDSDGLVRLRRRRLLTLPPADDPVLDRLRRTPRGLGEVGHLLDQPGVIDVQHVLRASVLHLLVVVAGVRARDVVAEIADVQRLRLGRCGLARRDLLDDHDAWLPSYCPLARALMAARSSVSASAVAAL
jgi:hypothetical protein